jgi:DNA-directed RNA polymerase specialized sigma24 family protein
MARQGTPTPAGGRCGVSGFVVARGFCPRESATGDGPRVRETLRATLHLQLDKATLSQLLTAERVFAGTPSPQPQPSPPWPQPTKAGRCLRAAFDGDPAGDHFCIRFGPADELGPQPTAAPPEPAPENLSLAAKLLQLLQALESGGRMRRAPPINVFLLRFRKNLSRREIARACHCSETLVAVRLRAIRDKLPWQPQQLRELSAQVEAMNEALTESRAKRIYRKGAVYGDEPEDEGAG